MKHKEIAAILLKEIIRCQGNSFEPSNGNRMKEKSSRHSWIQTTRRLHSEAVFIVLAIWKQSANVLFEVARDFCASCHFFELPACSVVSCNALLRFILPDPASKREDVVEQVRMNWIFQLKICWRVILLFVLRFSLRFIQILIVVCVCIDTVILLVIGDCVIDRLLLLIVCLQLPLLLM